MDQILLSATQLQLWTECKRKWGFKYLERLPDPPKPGAALGTEVQDEQVDPWLRDGRTFDFTRRSGEIAQKLVPLLPAPISTGKSPGLEVRKKFLMPSPTGLFAYRGEFDLYAPDSVIVPGLKGGRVFLGDVKTTGNPKYAKTEESLRKDIQCQLYSMDIMYETGQDELDAVWFYTKTKGSQRAWRVHLHVKAPDVVEQFQKIDAEGAELVTTRLSKPKIDDLPPNPRMCGEYGGCPYNKVCNLSPAVHADAVNREALSMSVDNEWLTKLRKDVGGPASAEPPPPAAAPAVEPEPPLPSWATAPVDPLVSRIIKPAIVMPAINPPESALPPAPPVGAAAPVEAPKKRGRPPKAKPVESTAMAATRAEPAPPAVAADTPLEVSELDLLSDLGFPRQEFAAFLRAWASRMEAA